MQKCVIKLSIPRKDATPRSRPREQWNYSMIVFVAEQHDMRLFVSSPIRRVGDRT